MVKEAYVRFETAKLLREKGFDGNCIYVYRHDGSEDTWDADKEDIACQKPTLQMAMKWLRKEHKLCVVSIPVVTDDDGDGGCLWNYVISRKLNPLYKSESLYESQETALNDAIKYCLENLI